METLPNCYSVWLLVAGLTTASWTTFAFEGIVINEFQLEGSQYVELYDGGVGNTQLDGLVLVLYSGTSEVVYNQPLVLDGFQTSRVGYFLVSFGPAMPNANVTSSTLLLTSGLNAIALYDQTHGAILHAGSAVTDVDLVDAVVYGSSPNPQDSRLVSVLSQGESPLQRDGLHSSDGNTSLSRCRGWKQVMHSSFRAVKQSPGTDNECPLPSFVINELNPTTDNSGYQFVEIFDGGRGLKATDGIVLVVYLGAAAQDNAVLSVDLTGYRTDQTGFLVVAANGTNLADVIAPVRSQPTAFLPVRQPTGVALHLGPPQRFATDKPVTDYNLIDAVVYLYQWEVDDVLVQRLTPGQHVVVDLPSSDGQEYSISRCYCCSVRNSSVFGRGPTSPGRINRECRIANRTVLEASSSTVRINELHIGTPGSNDGDLVEIYDGGFGPLPLLGKTLVVYTGRRPYRIVDLSESLTNSDGFAVIAPPSVIPSSTFSLLADDWLRAGLDEQQVGGAVALYERPAASFDAEDGPKTDGLLDAVVFGNSTMASELLNILSPGQTLIHSFLPVTTSSALRCYSHTPLDQVAFAPGPPSPLAPNSCPPPPCLLNEINSLRSSATGVWMEVSCEGLPNFPLDTVIGVWWQVGLDMGIARSFAGFKTNKDGFISRNMRRLGTNRHFALSLYFLPDATDLFNDAGAVRLTSSGLLGAIVVSQEGGMGDPSALTNILTPGKAPVQEQEAFSHRDESLSRCLVGGEWAFVLAHVSRDAANHCPTRANLDLVINEISLSDQFIELFDLGGGYSLLDEFMVVLCSATGVALQVIRLAGYTTDANGYFILGASHTLNPGSSHYILAAGFIDSLAGGVALYRSRDDSFTLAVGDQLPIHQALVDAVIYRNEEGSLDTALKSLISDESSVELISSDRHFSRCFSGELRSTGAFSGGRPPTVAAMNDCPVFADQDVVINEFNFAEPSGTLQAYVELYDGGVGNTPLTYITLVAFAASDNNGAYRTADLSGYRTNEQGYFLIGSQDSADLVVALERTYGTTVLSHGAGAIALYRSAPGVFYHGAPATKRSLVDAVVYTLDAEEGTTLVDDLLPTGSSIIYEDESLEEEDESDESISRCFDDNRLSQSAFRMSQQSPKGPNLCGQEETGDDATGLFISEMNVKSATGLGFVELYNGSPDIISLDGYVLIFYEGHRDRSVYEIDLRGKRISPLGYLVIGESGVTPTPDVIVDNLAFLSGPGAVAVYWGGLDSYPRGTVATSQSLVDVVVYGEPDRRADGLIGKLVPGQIQAYENTETVYGEDVSLSRCISSAPLTLAAFVSARKTPGSPNNCDALYRPVFINEISPYGSRSDKFIELYDGGQGHSSLDALVLLLLVEGFNIPYSVIPITGNQTDSYGYYLINNIPELRLNGSVALHRGDYALFRAYHAPSGSEVTRQAYSTAGLDMTLLRGTLTATRKTFSRCQSCPPSERLYLTLAPATPGYTNWCPNSDHDIRVSLTLTDASYDVWRSNARLTSSLERIVTTGIETKCRCGFSEGYVCGQKLLRGSVVYQADMYATDSDQARLLDDSFRAFLSETGTITVGGKTYSVAEAGDKNAPPTSGSPVRVAVVVPVVLAAIIVIIALSVAVGCFIKKGQSASSSDDDIKLEEPNQNVEFDNLGYSGQP
ncbi:uncharacterized protein LOC110978419 isoform X2 [Acanthaster planci]|uniref:Uncharacterized protein LOC110978419 isoform X2 n=1 Tax=Acanthaster planci TaxID=133434 RepID=A0A8B7Y976_ACAPL|nr:uncharacterized protein LOC110978419 isoform X2 [Acanthaster planci]